MSTENGELRRRLGLKHAVKVRKNDRFSKSDRALLKDYNLDENAFTALASGICTMVWSFSTMMSLSRLRPLAFQVLLL